MKPKDVLRDVELVLYRSDPRQKRCEVNRDIGFAGSGDTHIELLIVVPTRLKRPSLVLRFLGPGKPWERALGQGAYTVPQLFIWLFLIEELPEINDASLETTRQTLVQCLYERAVKVLPVSQIRAKLRAIGLHGERIVKKLEAVHKLATKLQDTAESYRRWLEEKLD
jgi:hypothetical protein